MKTIKLNFKNQKGFILMSSYLLISVLAVFSVALFARNHSFFQASERNLNKTVAFNMAEAGIDAALAQLATDPSYAGTGYTSLSNNFIQGGYQVNVTTPAGNANIRMIQATGFAPNNNNSSRAYETRTVLAYAQIGESNLFDFAVFADESLRLNGQTVVDSYDSRNGPYDANTAGQEGDIGTNSILADTVTLNGQVQVKGDVTVGPSGDPDVVIDKTNQCVITGETAALSEPVALPVPTTSLTSLGNLNIAGHTDYQLPAGTYRFDSIQIAGQATLTSLGPVTLYVDGSVQIAGQGVATQNNLPPNFVVYVTGNSDVHLAGQADFYGAIYAPNSHVQNNGQAEVYGAIVSNTYHQPGQSDVHFDEALKDVGGDAGGEINLIAWQEQNTSAWI